MPLSPCLPHMAVRSQVVSVLDPTDRSAAARAAMAHLVFERIARLSPKERIRASLDLTKSVLAIARAGIRQQHPGADDEEIRFRLCARMYGRETRLRFLGATGLRWCDDHVLDVDWLESDARANLTAS